VCAVGGVGEVVGGGELCECEWMHLLRVHVPVLVLTLTSVQCVSLRCCSFFVSFLLIYIILNYRILYYTYELGIFFASRLRILQEYFTRRTHISRASSCQLAAGGM